MKSVVLLALLICALPIKSLAENSDAKKVPSNLTFDRYYFSMLEATFDASLTFGRSVVSKLESVESTNPLLTIALKGKKYYFYKRGNLILQDGMNQKKFEELWADVTKRINDDMDQRSAVRKLGLNKRHLFFLPNLVLIAGGSLHSYLTDNMYGAIIAAGVLGVTIPTIKDMFAGRFFETYERDSATLSRDLEGTVRNSRHFLVDLYSRPSSDASFANRMIEILDSSDGVCSKHLQE